MEKWATMASRTVPRPTIDRPLRSARGDEPELLSVRVEEGRGLKLWRGEGLHREYGDRINQRTSLAAALTTAGSARDKRTNDAIWLILMVMRVGVVRIMR